MDIRFRAFHVLDPSSEKERGRVIAAIREDKDKAYISFSYCSPKDKYCKKYGQLIAFSRVNMKKERSEIGVENLSITRIKGLLVEDAFIRGVPWMADIEEKHLR
jgi:hypothetical protein